jgi:membrane protein DedA with SNARE-associated domain
LDFSTLLTAIGYPALFLGAFLEGETVLLIAGFLVHQGYFDPLTTWLIAMLGGTAGDQLFFYLGRAHADKVISKLPPHLRWPLGLATRLVANNPTFVLIMMRFLVGMRMLLPILCGAAGIRVRRFVAFNMATAAAWAAFFLVLGYLFGEAAKPFLKRVQAAELILVLLLILIAVIYEYVSRWAVEKMQERKE